MLLDVVARQLLTEARGGAVLVLGVIEHGDGGIERRADGEILLPGDLVRGVRLALRAGAEAHAGG